MAKHFSKLSLHEIRCFLQSFDLVISDCDGVIWQVMKPIPGVSESIQALKDAGKRVVYLSNNSIRDETNYQKKFESAGIEYVPDDLITPAKMIRNYLRATEFQGPIYVMSELELKRGLQEDGHELVDDTNDHVIDVNSFIGSVFNLKPVKAVILECDLNLSYVKLAKAARYLNDPSCLFIVGAADRTVAINPSLEFLGPGMFADVLKSMTKREPIVLGKPGNSLAKEILSTYASIPPKRILFVGDMLEQDIAFARLCGFQSLLVLTGGTSQAMVDCNQNSDHTPDYITDSFHDFVSLIKQCANA